MNPAHVDAPLRKVTMNLYEADCAFLEKHIGRGWSEHVRTLVHAYAHGLADTTYQKLTVGDLAE